MTEIESKFALHLRNAVTKIKPDNLNEILSENNLISVKNNKHIFIHRFRYVTILASLILVFSVIIAYKYLPIGKYNSEISSKVNSVTLGVREAPSGYHPIYITNSELKTNPKFAKYVPTYCMPGIQIPEATENQIGELLLDYYNSTNTLREQIIVSYNCSDLNTVDINDITSYDLSNLKKPITDEKKADIMNSPLFKLKDVTKDTIIRRTHFDPSDAKRFDGTVHHLTRFCIKIGIDKIFIVYNDNFSHGDINSQLQNMATQLYNQIQSIPAIKSLNDQ
jgi:hypothetical protein